MPKNIVILCDGTSNEIKRNRTNVLRLFSVLEQSDRQVVFYDPGVGTFGAENAPLWLQRKSAEVWGLATGWGLDANVKEAYRFIVDHYEHGPEGDTDPAQRDQIYLFGFSRGAYTARVLAGFIHEIGLIKKTNLNLLDYAYRAYKRIGAEVDKAGDKPDQLAFAQVRLFERNLDTVRPSIALLGLFDTVASVIEWGRWGYRTKMHASTVKNPSVAGVRHAVAIDEKRTYFKPVLWKQSKFRPLRLDFDTEADQSVREVWFRGCHGDIGGGNPEAKSGLAKIPLKWMIDEARALNVHFNDEKADGMFVDGSVDEFDQPLAQPDPCAPINPSMRQLWPIVEYAPRRSTSHVTTNRARLGKWFIPAKERRIIPAGVSVHKSVFDCGSLDVAQAHPNLPSDYTVVE